MDENVTKVIVKHETMVVEDDLFDQFISVCEKAREPNQALMEAAQFTEENGF
jgi:uncharacterized protein (DUF1778 family)